MGGIAQVDFGSFEVSRDARLLGHPSSLAYLEVLLRVAVCRGWCMVCHLAGAIAVICSSIHWKEVFPDA